MAGYDWWYNRGAPSQSTSTSSQASQQQATSQQQSQTYIPDYSETPILENIAKYSASMAPQVYQWGMQQYANNQGNIDSMMRNALSYASPQRIAADMGMAESGAAQGAEKGRQSALSDLQSYGIDPSAGRYAGLDQASRVMSGAATAGAGNQQRISDIATGNAMQNQAIASSLQNVQTGYGAANAANQFANTGMSLKYSPLGTESSGSSQSSGSSSGSSASQSTSGGSGAFGPVQVGPVHGLMAAGGPVENDATSGGFVSHDLSPSNGANTDDVSAQLNAGEFVIPRDVAAFKGQEHFYKLIAQARKARATVGNGGASVGYGAS
jgi:hypothetical protein